MPLRFANNLDLHLEPTMAKIRFLAFLVTAFAIGLSAVQNAAAEEALRIKPAKEAVHLAVVVPENVPWDASQPGRLVDAADPKTAVPAQAIPAVAADGTKAASKRLAAVVPLAAEGRRFVAAKGQPLADALSLTDRDGRSIEIREGDKPVLTYNYGPITDEKVPEKDRRRTQGCFVHPLWGLDGEVLTDSFPRDHYHHHGIFWTWPHVLIDGQEHDLWASTKGDVHQRFVAWLAKETGPVCAVLGVENGWYVSDRKVMIERVWLRAYRRQDDQRVLDVELTFIPVDKPIALRGAEGKSYGGLTVRFKPGSRQETQITVPAGPAKDDLPDTPLAWADFTSRFDKAADRSGAAVFVPTSHPDYPPTWLTRYYGPLCVGWPGVHDREFPPNVPIRMHYRVWIHEKPVDLKRLEAAYAAYGVGEEARWE
jgi:hypothetical protein